MSKFLLIGGRSTTFFGKSKIYEYMVNNAPNKTILYLPYANKNYEAGFEYFKKEIPNDAKVILASFSLLNDIASLDALFKEAGTIFFSGGSINDLMKIVEDYKIKEILQKYLNSDKVYAGISAGAILYCVSGMGDKDVFVDNGAYYNFKMVSGLGFVPITICPHYQKSELVMYNDIAKKYYFDGYALEDDTALFIFDKKIAIIKDTRKNSLYYLNKDEDYKLIPLYERN